MQSQIDQLLANILLTEKKYSLDIIRHPTDTTRGTHSANATNPGITGPFQAIDQQDNVFPWIIAIFLWYTGRYSLVWTQSTFPHGTLSKLPHQGNAGIGHDSAVRNSEYPFYLVINVTFKLILFVTLIYPLVLIVVLNFNFRHLLLALACAYYQPISQRSNSLIQPFSQNANPR